MGVVPKNLEVVMGRGADLLKRLARTAAEILQ